MSNLIQDKDGVVSFTLYKIEKGREKICKCNPPNYIIDEVNRLVTCENCGATLDAMEALLTLAKYMDVFEEYQDEALKKIEAYRKMANEELHRRFKNRAFKDMDTEYKKGLLPRCPRCDKMFEPMEIKHWMNKKYYTAADDSEEYAAPVKILLPGGGVGHECKNCGNELDVNSFNGNYCHWCGIKLNWNKESGSETEKIME